ncbi:formate/nitrite transporter family protein [Ruania suaedae]|uniref:formate/nitrite transporter family protein n=1 Tax=Ruania suaedae TaxID=2897774 RepID=UPI001E5D62D6|nr:formate/nitrite transporter family protein [Ruania suaedae]UFU04260.1 formate/nitrite transporter family protein [Ruania suaedae]
MVDQKRQRQRIGSNDLDVEDELLAEAADTVQEGTKRLNRRWVELIATGLFGGIDIGFGVLALVLVKQATGSDILAGMAFGVGLLALKLAHSELFTEEFLLPINAILAGQGTWWQLVRLWSVMLVGNLAGGIAFAWLIVLALPGYHTTLIDSANSYLEPGSVGALIGLSLLAGASITLSTRMVKGTTNDVAVAIVCMISGFLVIGLGLLHGALNAMIIFAAMFAGAEISVLQFVGWFAAVIPLNMIGGLVVITLPRLARTYWILRAVRQGDLTLEDLQREKS